MILEFDGVRKLSCGRSAAFDAGFKIYTKPVIAKIYMVYMGDKLITINSCAFDGSYINTESYVASWAEEGNGKGNHSH